MYKFLNHILFLIFLFPGLLSAQIEIPYNDTSYFIPNDIDFNLIMSASKGDQNNVQNLLNRGADVNAVTVDNISGLMYATENGDFLMVKLLLDNGANPNIKPYNGITALISAIIQNQQDIAELLINRKADINASDHDGISPAHYAAAYNFPEILKMLLYYGADPSKPDNKGNIPIVTAAWNNSQETLRVLLDHGVSINSQDRYGFTPLMVSVQQQNMDLSLMLIKNGADVNLENESGMTALAFAVSKSNFDLTKMLLEQGADVNHFVRGSYNILDIAKENNDKDILELLGKSDVQPSRLPYFEQWGIGTGIHFNSQDFMTTTNFTLFESKYNTDLFLNFSFRPVAIRVLTNAENDTLFQYWERRYHLDAGVTKRIALINSHQKSQSGPFASINGLITFGGYRGSTSNPEVKLHISPIAGWYYMTKRIKVQAGYQYLNFGISTLSPHRLNLSFAWKFNLKNKKTVEKNIDWLKND